MYTSQTRFSLPALTIKSVYCLGTLLLLCLIFADIAKGADNDNLLLRDTVFYNTPPSADDIGQHLFPAAGAESLTRSITFKNSQEQAAIEKSVSMPVLFHFGKTTIVEKSRPFLDSIGRMLLKAEYAQQTLIVEGHTDAVGSAASNQRLSELRALAIKAYLVKRYEIDPYRLFPIGQGESMLSKPESPTDGANRRVEFLPYQ
ncbi:MAG: OmpA family protein [Granulosicoccus sp.]